MAAPGAVPAVIGGNAGLPGAPKRKRRSDDDFRDDIVAGECVVCPRTLSGGEKPLNLCRLLSIKDAPVDFYACCRQCTAFLKTANLSGRKQQSVLDRIWQVVAARSRLLWRKGDIVELKGDTSPGRNVLPGSGAVLSITCDTDLGASYRVRTLDGTYDVMSAGI